MRVAAPAALLQGVSGIFDLSRERRHAIPLSATMHSSLKAPRVPMRQPPARSPRPGRLHVCCGLADNSVRVRGDVRRVFQYVSDFEHMTQWFPGERQRPSTASLALPL